MKQTLAIIAILLLLCIGLLLFLGVAKRDLHEEQRGFTAEIFAVADGFGYQILNGDRVLIKQDFIPVIPGKRPFSTADDAKMLAELVLKKLSQGESPVLTQQEIERLGIKP